MLRDFPWELQSTHCHQLSFTPYMGTHFIILETNVSVLFDVSPKTELQW